MSKKIAYKPLWLKDFSFPFEGFEDFEEEGMEDFDYDQNLSPFDQMVARSFEAHIEEVIEKILREKGHVENPIPFSIYRIGELMGLKVEEGDSIYKDIKESIKRIVATRATRRPV